MKIIDTDYLSERCSVCGQLIDSETPEPIIIIGKGKITFSYDPRIVANNLSVMHRDCYHNAQKKWPEIPEWL